MFPLFNRSKPPVTAQSPPEDITPTHPFSRPIDLARSDETSLQALEASKPSPTKSRVKTWKFAPPNSDNSSGHSAEDPIVLDLSLEAPLPTGETQHVRGLQTAFDSNANIPFKGRTGHPVALTSAGEPSTSYFEYLERTRMCINRVKSWSLNPPCG